MSALAMHPLDQLVLQPEPGVEAEAEVLDPVREDEREVVHGTTLGAGELGGEPSLDTLVSGMWEGLAAHRSVACLLCGGEVAPLYGVHHRPVGGRCRSCETTIS